MSKLPNFLQLNESIKTARQNLQLTQKNLYGLQGEAQSFSQRSAESQRLLVEIDATTSDLLEIQKTASSIFPQIGSLEELISIREAARSTKRLRQQELETKIFHEREELEKVQSIEVNEAAIDSTDLAPLLKENFSTLPLKAAILECQARANEFDAAIRNLDQVRAQANQFTQLIELGASLLSQSHSGECPLCTHQYPSHQALMDALVNNTALSDLESAALRTKEMSRAALDEASNKVSIQIAEWSAAKMRADMSLRSSIEKDESEIQALKIELDQIDQAISVTSLQLAELKNRVNNLPEEQLNSSIANQLSALSTRRSSELKDLEESSSKLAQLQKDIKEDLQKIEQLNAEIALAIESDLARDLNQFCVDNALQPDQIDLWTKQIRAEIQARISAMHARKESAHDELLSIDLTNPTLATTTPEELDKHEIELRGAIVDSDTTIVPFVATIRKHLQSYEDAWNKETLSNAVSGAMAQRQKDSDQTTHILRQYSLLREQLTEVKPYIESLAAKQKLDSLLLRIQQERALSSSLEAEYSKTIERLRTRINSFFYSDLINAIYRKIDPHPDFKEVQFDCDFPDESLPKLNVLVADSEGDVIAPNLYFSAAQINILSLSIFLARALHVKTADGMDVKCIFIDDPIHSMDSINVLSTIDMLRTLSKKFDRQIILSTHDRNFFDLLQKKIPQKEYLSKFIELETFGKVRSTHINSGEDSDIFS